MDHKWITNGSQIFVTKETCIRDKRDLFTHKRDPNERLVQIMDHKYLYLLVMLRIISRVTHKWDMDHMISTWNICDKRDLYSWQKRPIYTQKRPQRETFASHGSQIFVCVGHVAHNQSCHTQMRYGSHDCDTKYVSLICVCDNWFPHTSETHFMKDFDMKYKSWDHMISTWNMWVTFVCDITDYHTQVRPISWKISTWNINHGITWFRHEICESHLCVT